MKVNTGKKKESRKVFEQLYGREELTDRMYRIISQKKKGLDAIFVEMGRAGGGDGHVHGAGVSIGARISAKGSGDPQMSKQYRVDLHSRSENSTKSLTYSPEGM
jgi:hypothetical protein